MKRIMDERKFINSDEFKNYRKFAFKDDMVKLSVGIILGNSFNKVVQGVSDYLIMPLILLAASNTGTAWRDVEFSPIKGLTFEIGRLAGVFVDFLVVSILLYVLYIKLLSNFLSEDSNNKILLKQCPHCFSKINSEAKRCPMCTGGIVVKKRRVGVQDKGKKSS